MTNHNIQPQEAVEQLVDAGLLTERQAQAYVFREIDPTPRKAVAEMLDISPNVLDKHLSSAREKVNSAESTLATLDEIRHPDLPMECSQCGSTLGGHWSQNDTGDVMCLECADVDADER